MWPVGEEWVSIFFSSLPSWTLESGKLATAVSHWSSLPVVLLVRRAQVNHKGENELGLCLLRSLRSQEVLARLCQGFSACMNGGHFLTILPGGFRSQVWKQVSWWLGVTLRKLAQLSAYICGFLGKFCKSFNTLL